MKISPIAAGTPAAVNPSGGMSAGLDRLERAKAIANGQDPGPIQTPNPDPQIERAQNSIKRIKLKTQMSTNRHEQPVEVSTEQVPIESVVETPAPSDTLASIEQATQASEENKPLSPQFAALAKQKRAQQLKEQELLAKEKALEINQGGMKSLDEYRARIKANALSVLQEEGVTYDQLTEQILASNQENADLAALKAEIKALKEGFDNQSKSQTEREAQVERQVLAQIRRDADQLIAQGGDEYEMVREAGYTPKVVELIHKTLQKTGEILDVAEAASLIEKELLEESLKFARIKKVQSRLNPAPTQTRAVKYDRPGTKVMRTLTNRDGVSSVSMSKRERAIAAMEGRLK